MNHSEKRPNNSVNIDLAYLREFSGGDHTFIREIIETFLDEAPPNINKLREGANQSDWDTVYKMAHQLKPNYMMLGMKAQQSTALTVEQAAKKGGNETEIQKLVDQLVEDTHAAFPMLRSELEGLGQKKG